MAAERVVSRRRHSAQLRIVVLEQCAAPQASVAEVAEEAEEAEEAMSHVLNVNLIDGWPRLAGERDRTTLLHSRPEGVPVNPAAITHTGTPQFVLVSLDAMAGEPVPVVAGRAQHRTLPGACQEEVRRVGQGEREPRGCAGHPAHRSAVPRRGRCQGAGRRAGGCRCATSDPSRSGSICTCGCSLSANGCPKAAPLPRPSITA